MLSGFVFGFDDKEAVFEFSNWFFNFLKFAIYSFIALVVYAGAQYFVANKYGTTVNYNFWGVQRFSYTKGAYLRPIKFGPFTIKIKKIPLGILAPLLITFLSSGGLFFTGIISSVFTINPAYRLGRLFTKLTEFEEAKIAVSGAFANILLAILIKGMEINSLDNLVLVCSITAVSYMLPFPGLDGIKVYFGSKLLYIFSFAFILISAFSLNFISGFITLILAFLAALTILISYFYKKNQSKK